MGSHVRIYRHMARYTDVALSLLILKSIQDCSTDINNRTKKWILSSNVYHRFQRIDQRDETEDVVEADGLDIVLRGWIIESYIR